MAKSPRCAETTHRSKAALRPMSHVRLCLLFSILPFESVKVDEYFDMHLGY